IDRIKKYCHQQSVAAYAATRDGTAATRDVMPNFMKEIRHISTSFLGNRIALAEFENLVQIFDLNTLQVISEFNSVLSYGGKRIAIDEQGEICVCGAWQRHGICGYNSNSGELIWQRKDLKRVQHLQNLRSNQQLLFANFEGSSSRIIDFRTGIDIDKIPNIINYYECKYQSIDIYDRSLSIDIIDRISKKRIAKLDRKSFGTLDLTFNFDSLCISESAGPLSCYDLNNGKLKWRIYGGIDGHYLRICYNEHLNMFVGITWPYANGGDKKIMYINTNTGAVENEVNIKQPVETEFAMDGKFLITSNRQIIDIDNLIIKNWA
ncbi:MAG: YncE family protein, partial [Sediminibacterium sp.]